MSNMLKIHPLSNLAGPACLIVLVVYALFYALHVQKPPKDAPTRARGHIPLVGAVGFWTRRWDFFQAAARRSPTGNFSFYVGSKLVVGLTGEHGRQVFYNTRELNLAEGYAALFGYAPEVTVVDGHAILKRFNRYLSQFLHSDSVSEKHPTVLTDVHATMESIRNAPGGVVDPFESIHRLVFYLTMRMIGTDDLVRNTKLADQLLHLYSIIEASAGASLAIFPNIPTLPWLKRTYSGTRLYLLVNSVLKSRKASSDSKPNDGLQYLIDQGETPLEIIEFLTGTLFAALLNSGVNAASLLCYIACSPEWQSKARAEVRRVAVAHAQDACAPLHRQLDSVPYEAFDAEFPLLSMCLRESIRLHSQMAHFRKNTSGKAVPLGTGEVIPPGAFATYHAGDVHLDPRVYPEPEKWDPTRHSAEKAEDRAAPYGYLGWGVGRHPCMGMRFAKVEVVMIVAYFLAYFEFHLEDAHGNRLETVPPRDLNQHTTARPTVPLFLKTTPVV